MILIDTSVWINHFRKSDELMSNLLTDHELLAHPMVVGELLLGGFDKRAFNYVEGLTQTQVATNEEVVDFILEYSLARTGIGFVDAHLLVAAMLSNADLMTHDRSLASVADTMGLLYQH